MTKKEMKKLKVGRLVWVYSGAGKLMPMLVALVGEEDVALRYANHHNDPYFKMNGVTAKPEQIYLSN